MRIEISDAQTKAIKSDWFRLLEDIDAKSPPIPRNGSIRPQFGNEYPDLTALLIEICRPFTPPKLYNTRL